MWERALEELSLMWGLVAEYKALMSAPILIPLQLL